MKKEKLIVTVALALMAFGVCGQTSLVGPQTGRSQTGESQADENQANRARSGMSVSKTVRDGRERPSELLEKHHELERRLTASPAIAAPEKSSYGEHKHGAQKRSEMKKLSEMPPGRWPMLTPSRLENRTLEFIMEISTRVLPEDGAWKVGRVKRTFVITPVESYGVTKEKAAWSSISEYESAYRRVCDGKVMEGASSIDVGSGEVGLFHAHQGMPHLGRELTFKVAGGCESHTLLSSVQSKAVFEVSKSTEDSVKVSFDIQELVDFSEMKVDGHGVKTPVLVFMSGATAVNLSRPMMAPMVLAQSESVDLRVKVMVVEHAAKTKGK
jgi:hypothetical protein